MKSKIIVIALIVCLFGCESEEEPTVSAPTNLDYYQEVEKLETNMKKLDSYKISRVEDYEVPVCTMDNSVELIKENPNEMVYEVNKDGEDVAYRMVQKVENQIQYRTLYYIGGNFYQEFSQLAGDVKPVNDLNNVDLIMSSVFREIDTTYYNVEKKEEGENTVYTFELKKADKYNKKYPEDRDKEACGIVGDYKNQKLTFIVNKDGYILEERIEETITYKANEQTYERLNVVTYKFYDFNIPNELNFYFI